MSYSTTETVKKGVQAAMPTRSFTPPRSFLLPQTSVDHLSLETQSFTGTDISTRLGHDFGRVSVMPSSSSLDNSSIQPVAQPCPLSSSPRACPFGGACHTCPAKVQTKLKIGQSNDIYEQEADRVAEIVMRMPDSGTKVEVAPTTAPPIVHEVLRSPGEPLDATTRVFMESRFGYDFSQVRIHNDSKAAKSAHAVNALAYTVGREIVFGDGQYAPSSSNGKRLLSHELTHICQNMTEAKGQSLRRYEFYEHKEIGDETLSELLEFLQTPEGEKWIGGTAKRDTLATQIREDKKYFASHEGKISVGNGLKLTPGEIIGLYGDFYGSLSNLAQASKEEIESLLLVGKKQQTKRLTTEEANREFDRITKGRYLRLAESGAMKHLGPKNREEWLRLHQEAMNTAQKSGPNNDKLLQEALFIDTAGGHFLTDAFASGHTYDAPRVVAEIQSYLANKPPILTENPEMQLYHAVVEWKGQIPNLVLKNIHDHFNVVGFDVENQRGMIWKTFGDDRLKNARETRYIAALAVFESRQQIFLACKGVISDPKEILELLPDEKSVAAATKQAIAYIPEAVQDVSHLIYKQRGMISGVLPKTLKFLGPLIQSNIEAVGSPRPQQSKDDTGVKAQFNILSW
jgi:hypothetical protein